MPHLKMEPRTLFKAVFPTPPPSPTQLFDQFSDWLFQEPSRRKTSETVNDALEFATVPTTKVEKAPKIRAQQTFISPFPISRLPTELRHQIYEYYFASLPPLSITSSNASQQLNAQNPLALSSPFFILDTPSNLYYKHATFTFTSGKAMKEFASHDQRREKEVRKILIEYGKDKNPSRDWVVLMNACFEGLEEVMFRCGVVGEEKGGRCERCAGCERRDFESWWEALVDAVREGRGGGMRGNGRRREFVVRSWVGREEVSFVC